ncbi:4,5-DOPA-extradiol-dioxygenase [Anaeropeptidivorans aminofermentans]|uniref:4,5-DOPA-extradiol-dioxygenase n=1 Tax=Anaeropeptidivorans aminofermentans TaxID=2934315 RepID=UPI002024965E|nr:4,5-DOPA dioxygenase extradiol [Anaeropeptidivorans aminofermentans]
MGKMPVLFVGHGSPQYVIEENNKYTQGFRDIEKSIPRPKSILIVSAHWEKMRNTVMNNENPPTIHDFYGFPKALYEISYPAAGDTALAEKVKEMLPGETVFDSQYGLDHGSWAALLFMYPEHDIPVCQLSINRGVDLQGMYEIGRALSSLRDEGVLIIGSGNIVHNLRLVNFSMEEGYSWAQEFDNYIYENIKNKNIDNIINYKNAGESSSKAFTTIEHFAPLIYVLGAGDQYAEFTVFNKSCTMGSMSMTSYLFE